MRLAKKSGDIEKIGQVKELLNEEKQFSARQKNDRREKQQKDLLKAQNKERVAQGLEPIYVKRSEVKQVHLKEKFDKLEQSGKLENFLEKRHEAIDKKRARAN